MLNAYITDVQDLLHDSSAAFYSVQRLTRWINSARQQVAADAECIRVLAKGGYSSSVASVTVLNGGTGYGLSSVATFSLPEVPGGVRAQGTVNFASGVIQHIFVTNPGSGYLSPPIITLTGAGSGAILQSVLGGPLVPYGLQTIGGQEIYPFSLVNPFVQQTPGVRGVISVRQIAVYWGNLKPALAYEPWTKFEAFYRAYNFALMNFPTVFSQFGQGQSGSVYLWPIPAQPLGMEWDCSCVPLDLSNDTDVEAIPEPWTRAVKYWAASLAYKNAQRYDDANTMLQNYKAEMFTHRANVQRSVTPNYYYGS
jgi:hypothetical protein